MTFPILILGATRETDRVRAAMHAAKLAGAIVAMDWTEGRTSESTDSVHSDEDAERIAQRIEYTMHRVRLIWWLVPACTSQSLVEWDRARRWALPIITSGPEANRVRLFYRPPLQTHFHEDDLALAHIRERILFESRSVG